MNSSMPEKAMIWSSFDSISRLVMPRIVPFRKMFSPSGEVLVRKAGRYFNQCRKASVDDHAALGRLHNPAKDL